MSVEFDLKLNVPFLRFVIYRRGEYSVARCLEHDFAVQILDMNCINQEIMGMIRAQEKVALENGVKPFANMLPAPGKYQRMWAKAMRKEHEVTYTPAQEENSLEYVSQLAYA